MRDEFDFLPDKDLTYETLLDIARQNSFNPARDYFDRVQEEWDGIPRLGRFLPFYAGAADTPYVRAVGLLPFVAAVRRVREPGAKFDELLVVESPQGMNKSSAFEIMAVGDIEVRDAIAAFTKDARPTMLCGQRRSDGWPESGALRRGQARVEISNDQKCVGFVRRAEL
jgi:predicted P-loop ATPase